jgi:L-fuconolactonase
VIDAHVHIWDRDRVSYAWLSRAPFDGLPRSVGVQDVPSLPGERGLVLVEAGADRTDASALLEASAHPRVAGVVPALPATAHELDLLLRSDRHSAIKAVRWQAQRVPGDTAYDPRGLADRFAPARDAGLGLEIVTGRPRAREAVGAGLDAGASRVLVDHLAGLPREAERPGWRADLAVLGGLDLVTLKLSGFRSAAAHELLPVVADALERVPVERLVWGSDWPVAHLGAASRAELFAGVTDALVRAGLDADGLATVMGGAAADWYRLTS